jgi:hypothetical protein
VIAADSPSVAGSVTRSPDLDDETVAAGVLTVLCSRCSAQVDNDLIEAGFDQIVKLPDPPTVPRSSPSTINEILVVEVLDEGGGFEREPRARDFQTPGVEGSRSSNADLAGPTTALANGTRSCPDEADPPFPNTPTDQT